MKNETSVICFSKRQMFLRVWLLVLNVLDAENSAELKYDQITAIKNNVDNGMINNVSNIC